MVLELPPPAFGFTVYGVAATKGSKRAFPVRKGGTLTGRSVVVDDSRPALRTWTAQVTAVIEELASADGWKLVEGPLEVRVTFYLPKPKSAPKSRRTWPARKPDLDKLLRALLDPMTGVLFRDDAQIVRLDAAKRYADDDVLNTRPRVEVWAWRTEELEAPVLARNAGSRTGGDE
ncbi:MAG TPA: RusA family crossover junction endodeoxyribonuclease [Actinomycetota bacterium]|nr:RusA family crossover junction endodeoxyribonuclease [Actinomycetota bacterium]